MSFFPGAPDTLSNSMEHCLGESLLGGSLLICKVRLLIAQVAPSRLPVLIYGPTGSGKELVSQMIHRASHRTGALVAVNVCAIGDALFEDALFGHVRGAFTGAASPSAGYLVEAHGGTLFLDEISGLSLEAQAKLLRAIETRVFRQVGARSDRASDFRLVAATNEDLAHLVRSSRFRPDLAYRLRGFVIRMPSLAERPEDIPVLARHFLAREAGPARTFGADALEVLVRHAWPGNVRELRHVVEVLALTSEAPMIRHGDVTAVLRAHGDVGEESAHIAYVERRLFDVLERVGWNMSAAARELGIDRKTVRRRVRRLGLSRSLLHPLHTAGSGERNGREPGQSEGTGANWGTLLGQPASPTRPTADDR